VLVRIFPEIRRQVPEAALLIVGDGAYGPTLRRLARDQAESIVFAGAAAEAELPLYYAAADIFAMPCRSRYGGLEVEGLGIVYLEAAASARPVIAGASGGAPETVHREETGYVVDGQDFPTITDRITMLLGDPVKAARMGAAGRRWVEQQWQWGPLAERLQNLLHGPL
jgi:phosphatidylinositol alpha-1,6-mannosyltransferase